jgi:2,4-dienoyl-CoA reductase-like NADH-dependent reductase (Old Yellow Enzyme family)
MTLPLKDPTVAQPTLFDPVRIARLDLRNRVVMAPMTRRF